MLIRKPHKTKTKIKTNKQTNKTKNSILMSVNLVIAPGLCKKVFGMRQWGINFIGAEFGVHDI